MNARRLRTLVALPVLAGAFAAGHRASAEDFTLPFQVPDRSTALRHVLEYERAVKGGDWTLAVDHLQQLFDLPPGDAAVIRAPGVTPARWEGSNVVARRLFDALPEAGRTAWETHSRGRAERLLAQGIRRRREQDLRDAARQYPALDVRRRAHDALAQLALVRSDLAAAQFNLQALAAEVEPANRGDVLARLAVVCAQSGDIEALTQVRAAAASVPDVLVPSAKGAEPLAAFVERMSKTAGATLTSTRQFGGDAHGSGLSEPPPAPELPRWWTNTNFQEGIENDSDYSPFMPVEDTRMRPVHPVVAQGLVYVNNGMGLRALDLSSGSVTWHFEGPQRLPMWRDSFVALHTAAVADGVVYAPLVSRVETGDPGFDRKFYGRTIIYGLVRRSLYAMDARTGELLWSHDPSQLEGREDEAELRKESISSPPLVVGDDVVVSAFTYSGIYNVRLVCFDRRTGRTRWRTSVVEGQQELNLFGRPVKELTTSSISSQGNRLFFATGLGVAASIERDDGRIAWLTAYPQTPIPRATQWHQTRDRDVTWWPSPVASTETRVVMAPPDGPDLLAFDTATGELRWRRSRHEQGNTIYRWFLGVTGGRAYVLGSRLMAYDIVKGEPVWSGPDAGRLTPPKMQPDEAAGAGILTRERVYVPTRRSMVALSTTTGAIEAAWQLVGEDKRSEPATGNLVTGDGALLFVNRDRIDASYSAEERLARLDARARDNPDDPQAQLDAGEARIAAGRLDEAITAIDAGFRRLPQVSPRVRDALEGSLRRALYQARLARSIVRRQNKETDGAAADLRAAAEVARDKGDAVRALFALADLLSDANRTAEAETALRRIATEFTDIVTAPGDGSRPQAAGALALYRLGESSLRAGKPVEAVSRWLDLLEQHGREDLGDADVATEVRARLLDLAGAEGSLVTTAVHSRALKAFNAAKAAGDAAALDTVARLYPDPDVAGQAALAAADLHLAAGRASDAVGVLRSFLSGPHAAGLGAKALWKLAAAYRAIGETARERNTLRRLAEESPNEVVDGTSTAAEAARRELASPRFSNVGTTLADPVPPLEKMWEAGGGDQLPPQVLDITGTPPEEMDGRMLLSQFGTLRLVEATTGKPAWEHTEKIEIRHAAGTPGAVVLVGSDTSSRERRVIVASLNAGTGNLQWRQPLPGSYRQAATSLGILYVLHADGGQGGIRAVYKLTALSLGSGEVLATKDFGGAVLPQITVAEDAVVLIEPVRDRGLVRRSLVVLDGTTLSLRGRLDLTSPSSPFCLHPPISQVVVTTDGAGQLAAADVTRGDAAWRPPVRLEASRSVKNVMGVPHGIIVSDDGDTIRRIDADTGREEWQTSLAAHGTLAFYVGEAAFGDLVVATVKPRQDPNAPPGPALAIALDAATGKERWRRPLPAADETHPVICQSVVAFELNERLQRGTRSRVILLDRQSGVVLQEIEHPTIGKSYQGVRYGPRWIALSSASELAIYGRSGAAATGAK